MMNKEHKQQVFRCDCGDRGHYIDAWHYTWESFEEIFLTFVVKWGDWTVTQHGEFIKNFFRRIKFRIKNATRILFMGYVELEDSWIPARFEGELKFLGEDTLKEFIVWLDSAVKKARDNINERESITGK